MEDNSFYDELAASAFETDDNETEDEQTADEEETEDHDDETDYEEIELSDEFYIEEARRKLEVFRHAVETEDYIATKEQEYEIDKEEAASFFESLQNISPITITNSRELDGLAAILANKHNWKGTVIVVGEVGGDLWNRVMRLVTRRDGKRREGVKVRARP